MAITQKYNWDSKTRQSNLERKEAKYLFVLSQAYMRAGIYANQALTAEALFNDIKTGYGGFTLEEVEDALQLFVLYGGGGLFADGSGQTGYTLNDTDTCSAEFIKD